MAEHENLARRPGARATRSVVSGMGGGVQDTNYIRFAETPWDEAKWCDTYDGLNVGTEDWWAIEWPHPVGFNVVQFVHGPMFPNGGWWTSLAVQVATRPGEPWRDVTNLHITPPYDFADRRGSRAPYETYTAVFDPVEAVGVRLIGKPGGPSGCTTLAKLSVFSRERASYSPPIIPAPVPRLLRLLDPSELWDILADYEMVTGILFSAETPAGHHLSWYLEQGRLEEYCRRSRAIISDPDNFRRILGDAEGWAWFGQAQSELRREVLATRRCSLRVHHGGLADIAAPIAVDGEVIGILTTEDAIFCGQPDRIWHQENCRWLKVDQARYFAAMERVPVWSRRTLEVITQFLGRIAGLVANLAHQNLVKEQQVQEMQSRINALEAGHQNLCARAVSFMEENVAGGITIEDVAREVGMSPVHFSFLFKQAYGKSPKQFLIDLRIQRAKEMLRAGALSVSEVASHVGYDSPKTFFRLFRSRTGLTPLEYQRSVGRRVSHPPSASG